MIPNNSDIEYKELLILIYLNNYGDEYMLSEILLLCDLSTKQLNRVFVTLEKNGYITNQKIIKLTEKSQKYLLDNGYNDINIEKLDDSLVTLDIEKTKLSFSDIYIPIKFKL